ncbi:MAG: glycosyltransferase [Patescibacteria group bacterium]
MSKQKQPLVSVVMPVYNAGDFLVPAIESILNQTYANFELILINDASTDKSLITLKKYLKKNPSKIKLINLKNNLNAGGDACANMGLALAQGKYIARMDADDISHPERLEKQVAFLETHPDVFLVGSNALVINKNGIVIGEKTEPLSTKAIYKGYMTFHPLIHPTTMFHRVFKGETFRYDIRYNANNDYYTFFKLLCQGRKFVNLEDKLLFYRIHGKNDTFVHMKGKFLNTLRIRVKMCLRFGYRPTLKAIILTMIQGGVIFVLPDRLITELYYVSKGIKKLSFPTLRRGESTAPVVTQPA